jgi:hypothetical protein
MRKHSPQRALQFWKQHCDASLWILSLLFSVASIFTLFAPAVLMSIPSSEGNVITQYHPAYSFVFGGNIQANSSSYDFKGQTMILLIAWIFVVIGLLFTLATGLTIRKSIKAKRYFSLIIPSISSLILVSSSCLFFFSKKAIAETLCIVITGSLNSNIANTINGNLHLCFGVWGAGLFSLLSGLMVLAIVIRWVVLESNLLPKRKE